jgi:hypothetical protein
LATRLHGYEPAARDRAVDRILGSDHLVKLEPLEKARELVYGLADRYRSASIPRVDHRR